MAAGNEGDREQGKGLLAMKKPRIVSQKEWAAAREKLLVKEKAVMHARDTTLVYASRAAQADICLLYTSRCV